jgi:hypothetical protein
MEVEIERLPSGEFQFVRHRQSTPKRNHPDRGRRIPLSLPEIEHLIQIYAATGEGRGAYLASTASEERQYGRSTQDFYRSQPRYYSRGNREWSSSSDDSNPPGDQTARRGPSGGPAPGGPTPQHMPEPRIRHYGLYDDGIYEDRGMSRRKVSRKETDIPIRATERLVSAMTSGGRQSSGDDNRRRTGYQAEPQMYQRPYMEEELESEDGPRRSVGSHIEEDITMVHQAASPQRVFDVEREIGHHHLIQNIQLRGGGGGGSDYGPRTDLSTEDSKHSVRLRGRNYQLARLPTSTSAIGAFYNSDDTDATPREIE